LVDIHFAKLNAALAQKILGPPAIAAPTRAVHGDFSHIAFIVPAKLDAGGAMRIQVRGR
jgi:hypothetical protein